MSSRRRKSTLWTRRRTPVGASPGTLVIDPEAPKPVIRVIGYGPDEFVEREIREIDSIREELPRHAVTWINVDGLGDAAVLSRLAEIFDLHRLALEDVVHVHQRPKVEEYEEHSFIVGRMARPNDVLETEQLSLFLGKNFVLTLQERPGDCLEPVRERIRKGAGRIRGGGPGYLAYALIDAVIDAYFPLVEKYGDRLEDLEVRILGGPDRETVQQLHNLKRELLNLRRIFWPMRDALATLVRAEGSGFDQATRVYLRDTHDHAVQLMEIIETYREFSASLVDLHLSSVSNRVNEVMKLLTIIATIFMPLSFIAGLYGMNFNTGRSPWNLPELNWYWGYPFALGLMAAVAVVMLLYFHKRGWFR